MSVLIGRLERYLILQLSNNGVRVMIPIFNDGLIILRGEDGSYIRYTNEGVYYVDPYENETCITDVAATYKQNAPTYDELYQHWLKTKDMLGDD